MGAFRKVVAAFCCFALSFGLLPVAAFGAPDTDSLADALKAALYEEEDVGYSDGTTASADCASATVTVTVVPQSISSVDGTAVSYVSTSYTHPVTGKEVSVTPVRRDATLGQVDEYRGTCWVYSFKIAGLAPGANYSVPFHSTFKLDSGQSVTSGSINLQATTAAMTAPSVAVTKISVKQARATVTMPAAMRIKGIFKVELFAGSKRIKSWTSTDKATYAYSYKKKGAAKLKYKAKVTTVQGSSGRTSAAVKPKANQKTWKRSKAAVDYGYAVAKCLPTKVSYNKKGKLTAKVLWVNTLLSSAKSKLKAKVTVKCQGKTIAKQTFTSKQIKRMSTKSATITFKKAKKGYDLRNGDVTWNVKVTKK